MEAASANAAAAVRAPSPSRQAVPHTVYAYTIYIIVIQCNNIARAVSIYT